MTGFIHSLAPPQSRGNLFCHCENLRNRFVAIYDLRYFGFLRNISMTSVGGILRDTSRVLGMTKNGLLRSFHSLAMTTTFAILSA